MGMGVQLGQVVVVRRVLCTVCNSRDDVRRPGLPVLSLPRYHSTGLPGPLKLPGTPLLTVLITNVPRYHGSSGSLHQYRVPNEALILRRR